MRWEGERQSDNVEDKREQMLSGAEIGARIGLGAAGLALLKRGGGKWILIAAVALIIMAFLGFSLFPGAKQRFMAGIAGRPAPAAAEKAEAKRRLQFVAVVLAETEDVWKHIFAQEGRHYEEPRLILYRAAIRSACGAATTSIGPFYCPNDQIVYLDESFFDQLAKDFGAPGEFASAYVIAHEIGHHIQALDGTLTKIDVKRDNADETAANALTVRLELQADCYAGIWANFVKHQGITEGNDISSALNAAHKIGDDNLQKASQGYAVPDSFTHGSSTQRAYWFNKGLQSGDRKSCNAIIGKI